MMNIMGQAIDATTRQPLQYASITVVDDEGNSTGVGTSADVNGRFSFTTSSNYVLITYTGYQPTLIETAALSDGTYRAVEMVSTGGDLTPVTVTATAHKKTNWLLWGAVAALTYYALK